MATSATARRVDKRTKSARAQGRDGRATLLGAAMEVFAERGYQEAAVDEIAGRAGYSKGAIYFHFSGKEDLFFALLEERVDGPLLEGLDLLATEPPEHDMALEASRLFVDLVGGQRDLLLLEQEYRSLAIRDPRLRRRYVKRQRRLRSAFGAALAARLQHLGAPPVEDSERTATSFMAVISGLAQERLIDQDAVPDGALGEIFSLLYAGHLARAGRATGQA